MQILEEKDIFVILFTIRTVRLLIDHLLKYIHFNLFYVATLVQFVTVSCQGHRTPAGTALSRTFLPLGSS
jgi:hypothetical protein